MKPVEARKFGDSYIAVDCIAEIELGTAYQENKLYKYLAGKRKITGRVVSFEEHCIVLDTSTSYHSMQFDICYDHVVDIKDVTREELFP